MGCSSEPLCNLHIILRQPYRMPFERVEAELLINYGFEQIALPGTYAAWQRRRAINSIEIVDTVAYTKHGNEDNYVLTICLADRLKMGQITRGEIRREIFDKSEKLEKIFCLKKST